MELLILVVLCVASWGILTDLDKVIDGLDAIMKELKRQKGD